MFIHKERVKLAENLLIQGRDPEDIVKIFSALGLEDFDAVVTLIHINHIKDTLGHLQTKHL